MRERWSKGRSRVRVPPPARTPILLGVPVLGLTRLGAACQGAAGQGKDQAKLGEARSGLARHGSDSTQRKEQ